MIWRVRDMILAVPSGAGSPLSFFDMDIDAFKKNRCLLILMQIDFQDKFPRSLLPQNASLGLPWYPKGLRYLLPRFQPLPQSFSHYPPAISPTLPLHCPLFRRWTQLICELRRVLCEQQLQRFNRDSSHLLGRPQKA